MSIYTIFLLAFIVSLFTPILSAKIILGSIVGILTFIIYVEWEKDGK